MTWTAQIDALLAPLEDFTRLHAATVHRFGAKILDLSFPNPRFLGDPRPYQALAETAARAGPADLRYSPFGGFTPVRRRLAASLTRPHELAYTWADVIMTPGAAAAVSVALRTLFVPPDRIMLIRPCWMDYPLYLAQLGLGYDLIPAAPDKHLDIEAIERAWTPQTRAIILSQPASPTGVVYSSAELHTLATALQRIRQRHGNPPVLIADEAHHDQVWSGVRCCPPATTYAHTITVRSLSKAWEMQGQRIGYLAVSPRINPGTAIRHRLEQGMRLTGHCAPTALMQHVTTALSDVAPDLAGLASMQHDARRELRRLGAEVLDADATRFLYVRCPTGDDVSFVTSLADRGVLTMPSTLFHEAGWFRIALNLPQSELSRGLSVIGKAVTAHA